MGETVIFSRHNTKGSPPLKLPEARPWTHTPGTAEAELGDIESAEEAT